jgi:hypothetical protein
MKFKIIAALCIALFVAIGLRLALVAFDIIPSTPVAEPIQQFEKKDMIVYTHGLYVDKNVPFPGPDTLLLNEEYIILSGVQLDGYWKNDTFFCLPSCKPFLILKPGEALVQTKSSYILYE